MPEGPTTQELDAAIARNRQYWETLWEDKTRFTPGDPIFITPTMARDLMKHAGLKGIPNSYYVARPIPAAPVPTPSVRPANRAERRLIKQYKDKQNASHQ